MADRPVLGRFAMTRAPRRVPGMLVAGALAGVMAAGCAGGGVAAREPAVPSAPSEFAATFDVESLMALVAGESQAWVLRSDDAGASLSRVDHTGRSTDVVSLPGQSFGMAPYGGGGVVVTRRACAAEECEETAVKVLVVDAAGATVAEEELAREFGGLESSGEGPGAELRGVHDDVVWVYVGGQLIGHDVATGRTTTAEAARWGGIDCVLTDGLYRLVVVDEDYFADEILVPAEGPGPVFDVEIRRLVDGAWEPLPDSRRGLTYDQIYGWRCLGGGVHAGGPTTAGPVWSAASGWVERGPYLRPPDLAAPPEPTARGSAGQLFVLESSASVRRWFAGPDGPMSSQALDVPADLFEQLYEPSTHYLFDASDTVVTGCVQRLQEREIADCYLGSR